MVNAEIPFLVNNAMNRYKEAGIVHDLKSIPIKNWWYPILDDYLKGYIPEKYFVMFKSKKEKNKRVD